MIMMGGVGVPVFIRWLRVIVTGQRSPLNLLPRRSSTTCRNSFGLSRRFEDMTWPRRLLVSSAVKAGNFRSQKSSPAAHA
jgi:hypothetical protein